VDRLEQSTPSVDELKQIQNEARSSQSLRDLRNSFDRVQELRRIHADNFDVQLVAAEAQEKIIERARELQSRSGSSASLDELFRRTPPRANQREQLRDTQDAPEEVIEEERPLSEEEKRARANWRRATYLALFLTATILAIFFYLIQTARRINLPQEAANTKASAAGNKAAPLQNTSASTPTVSTVPTLRLYTDLIPGTVSIDDGDPQDLKDGELVLDNLEPGRHSIKVAGRSGSADFSFDVSAGAAPQPVAPIAASNAMAVLVSAKDGKGHLLTSVQQPDISLDGKPMGQAGPDGLALDSLGTTDHDLQISQGSDKQRFVMTYTSAPVLTVYVKSDLNAGTVTVSTKVDGVSVYINDKLYRRVTDRGQIRLPLKVGGYVIRVHKDGFVDPEPQSVDVKKGEEKELSFNLRPLENLASLEVQDAVPGTVVLVDKNQVAVVGADGKASANNLKNGDHSVELRMEGSVPKKFDKTFEPGKTVLLAGVDSTLEKQPPPTKAAEQPAVSPTTAESTATDTEAAQPPPKAPVDVPGEHVRRGGGFVPYNTPKSAGNITFQAHSKIGGFLKHDKLQWYAAYKDNDNYVMYSLDGKHASVRQVKGGKSTEVKRLNFNATSGEWVQVDLSVTPTSINARIRKPELGWTDLGSVSSDGGDFTQDRVGFYVPGNDEVTVSNFHFAKH
jgi:hypothetical protein